MKHLFHLLLFLYSSQAIGQSLQNEIKKTEGYNNYNAYLYKVQKDTDSVIVFESGCRSVPPKGINRSPGMQYVLFKLNHIYYITVFDEMFTPKYFHFQSFPLLDFIYQNSALLKKIDTVTVNKTRDSLIKDLGNTMLCFNRVILPFVNADFIIHDEKYDADGQNREADDWFIMGKVIIKRFYDFVESNPVIKKKHN